eukprot:12886447-Alexandrium_andersonii.AAC.1
MPSPARGPHRPGLSPSSRRPPLQVAPGRAISTDRDELASGSPAVHGSSHGRIAIIPWLYEVAVEVPGSSDQPGP